MKSNLILQLLMVMTASVFTACGSEGKSNSTDASADSISELSDAETEDLYGDSPAPEWNFVVVTEEDKATHGEESYLHAGGLTYQGLTIKSPEGYAEYSNRDDYQSLVTLFYLADHLAWSFSKSGDAYPSKNQWREFEDQVLKPLCEGAWNWEAIPVKKWKKAAGDYYYTLENADILIGDRRANWQSYLFYYQIGTTEWKNRLVIKGLSEHNEFNLPEGTLYISTYPL